MRQFSRVEPQRPEAAHEIPAIRYGKYCMTLPNFFVIGDIKAGSTSIDHHLRQHPDVFMPTGRKELRYFAFDDRNPFHANADSYRVRSLQEYRTYFDACSKQSAIGEVSPNYLRSPTAADAIHQEIPDARIIVSLRNPADRLFSTYLMQSRNANTRVSFEEQAFGNNANWIKANFCWFDLKRYFDRFSRERIHVVRFDDLQRSPQDVMRHIFRFLEVDDSFVPDVSIQNRGGIPKNRITYASLDFARKHLKRVVPNPSPRFKATWGKLKRQSLHKPKLDQSIRELILEACCQDIEMTQELTGCDLSIWFEQ